MIAEGNPEAAVSLRQVAVRRERFTLGPLNIEVPRGLVTAIVGPNGSGKSTLFRLLLKMEPYDDGGEVEVLGHPVRPGADESFKTGIGYLAELPHAYEDPLTAEEKARFASMWYPGWDWDRYRKLIRSFDAESPDKLKKMSKGMRRKVELACALAHNPELLLLDEPSSGLDPFAWKTMLGELQRYMEQGDRTMIIASHITEEVRRLADCILFVHRGKALGFYEKDQLFDSWRALAVTSPEPGRLAELAKAPGVQGVAESAPGIYQLETDLAEEAEAYCRERGFQVMGSRRMELEDILSCLIRKEDARR